MKRKDEKRAEGEVRNTEWRKMSAVDQLADLDRRLGYDVGAKRQRAKLRKLLDKAA